MITSEGTSVLQAESLPVASVMIPLVADDAGDNRLQEIPARPFTILMVKPFLPSPTRTCAPPLGILYLISVLRAHFGDRCTVHFLDMSLDGLMPEYLVDKFPLWKPDVIGVSALNCEAGNAHRIAELAKVWNPGCLTVLGGPYALHNSKMILETSAFDWAVEGTGERTLISALDRYLRDLPLADDLPGLSYKKPEGGLRISKGVDLIHELDELPMPAWDLVNFDGYGQRPTFNGILKNKRYATIFTSRGCPYLCNYCHDVFTKKFVHRSPESVIKEIEVLHEQYGINEIQIVDDIFNLHKPRLKQIMGEVKRRWGGKILFAFPNGLRADILDEEVIDALVAGGTYSVAIAIETATPRLQKLIDKNLDIDKAFWAIRELDKRGVAVTGFFMLGFPTETPEEIEKTIQFALHAGLTQAYFFRVVPQPGTPLYDLAAKENLAELERITQEDMNDGHYRSGESWYERAYGFPLNKVISRANLRFYFRPKTVYRILRYWPLWSIFKTLPSFFAVIFHSRIGKKTQIAKPE